jgi:hypothetical protein
MTNKLHVWQPLVHIIVTQRRSILLVLVIIVPLYALRWQSNENDGSSLARAFFLLPIVIWLFLLGLILFGWLLYLIVGTRSVHFPLVMLCATVIAWLLPLPPPPIVRVFLAHRVVFETLVTRVQQEQQLKAKQDVCIDIPADVKTIHWDGHICSLALREHPGERIIFPLFEGVILYSADPAESFDATYNRNAEHYRPIQTNWYYSSNGRKWPLVMPDN